MYPKILVPLDGSELAECVLSHVESIADGCGTHEVTFLRVLEPVHLMMAGDEGYTYTARDWERIEADNRTAAENYLGQLMERTRYKGAQVHSEIMSGRPAEGIVDYAGRNGIDLIALASHGRGGISRWVFGSVADRVVRSSSVPVLLIRAPGCTPEHPDKTGTK
jgi:nucleotide-binding universal stress UspA family protein